MRALLDAGAALREAQLGGAGPDELRAATKAEREAVSRLMRKAAGLVAASMLDRLGETLRRAALSEPDLLERGLLTREPEAAGFEALSGMKPAPKRKDSRAEERKQAADEKQRAEEAKRRVRELRDEVRVREQELDAAARALERARDELAVLEERL